MKLGQGPVRHPAHPRLNTSMKLSLHFREAGCKLLSPFSSTLSRSVLSLRLSFIPERRGKAAYCFFFFFPATSKCSGKAAFNETFSPSPGSTYRRRGKRQSRGVSWGQAYLWKEKATWKRPSTARAVLLPACQKRDPQPRRLPRPSSPRAAAGPGPGCGAGPRPLLPLLLRSPPGSAAR